MRQFILVLASAAVGSIMTAIVLEPHAAAVGGQGGVVAKCSAQNGDVNADGKIDLADPVTILGHLFLGSPTELVPLCTPPPASAGLPDTGQTTCYDGRGVGIPCDRATCPGQDGSYPTGCPLEGRFVDNRDGTVTDNCTGLMWQKDTADVNGDRRLAQDGSDKVSWCDALTYCENLSFAGHDDWRLPNVRELQSIVDYGISGLAIRLDHFGAFSVPYWSSSSVAADHTYTWLVDFGNGDVVYGGGGLADYNVRAVRNAP